MTAAATDAGTPEGAPIVLCATARPGFFADVLDVLAARGTLVAGGTVAVLHGTTVVVLTVPPGPDCRRRNWARRSGASSPARTTSRCRWTSPTRALRAPAPGPRAWPGSTSACPTGRSGCRRCWRR